MVDLDKTDEKIISALQANARISLAQLARRLGMARTTIQARIERMENQDIIAGYGLRFGESYTGSRVRATILTKIASGATTKLVAQLRNFPEVESVNTTSGRYDLIINVSVSEIARLDHLIDEIENVEGFNDSETLVHLSNRLNRNIS